MEVFYTNDILQPLSTTYAGDSDLQFKGVSVTTDDGLRLCKENYLISTIDNKINNYNALYLTSTCKNGDILELKENKSIKTLSFSTSLKYDGRYICIGSDLQTITTSNTPSQHTTFEVERSTDNLNCSIAHQVGFDRYYLHYNGNFFFDKNVNLFFSQFQFILDKNTLFLFARRSHDIYSIAFDKVNSTLAALDYNSWKNNGFEINYYIQEPSSNLNSSWASYESQNKNSLVVAVERSSSNLSNNNVVYSNYTYITGGLLASNLITLKNHNTHKNYSYRADNLHITDSQVPNTHSRDYTSMHTGVDQEQGSDSITLTYEFYNADYKFIADKYTVFTTPPSMYPYQQLNINDTMLQRNGAMASDNPYTADKIFCKDSRPRKLDGQYMCTWLSGSSPDGESVWVDRYYIPEKTSFAAALTSRSYYTYKSPIESYITGALAPSAYYDAPFIWDDVEEELAHTPQNITDALFGEYFFDKRSDLVFVPGSEYIYYRVGDNCIDDAISSLSGRLIQGGLNFKTCKGIDIVYDAATDDIEYTLDNNSYALMESFKSINNTNEFTLAFSMHADDWHASLGHEILGNYNDRGFGVFRDQMITPIIMIQDGRRVVYANTNFDVIDTVFLSQTALDTQAVSVNTSDGIYITTTTNSTKFAIKDIHRTDHLDIILPSLGSYKESTTSVTLDPHFTAGGTGCGLLLNETGGAVTLDANIASDSTPISGIIVQPCKARPGLIPVDTNTEPPLQ